MRIGLIVVWAIRTHRRQNSPTDLSEDPDILGADLGIAFDVALVRMTGRSARSTMRTEEVNDGNSGVLNARDRSEILRKIPERSKSQ